MEYRPLGNTGIDVPLIGLGTVKLGRDQGVRYPRPFIIPDAKAAATLLRKARDLGVNLLDTAPAYGNSEARLGELLGTERDEWIICTKVGEEFSNGISRFDFSPEHTQRSVERSLTRLRTDRLDIVLIHSSGADVEILETMGTLDALRELKSSGRVRAIGISHKTTAGGRRALAEGCDVIMTVLNPEDREQAPVVAEAGHRGCGVLVKKALASGFAGPDSLKWVAAQPGVSCIVTGTIDPDHLAANVAAVSSH
ncbi:MAG: aldo/keto reductase [Pseudomonadales bacterium]|nr:aldo/keto reductase [Pseudomonadales bacterium]NIX07096.1 aldo/keto reductase [Pseudomonadales bacterium]